MATTRRILVALCMMLAAVVLIAAPLAAQAQTSNEQATGKATVTSKEVTGEVVQVEGNDLVVKLSSGEVKTFRVPPARKFVIDGAEVGVSDLKAGTTLTATVTTKTTPVTVRTRAAVTGTVWFAAPPTVILTLPNGENKQYTVRDEDNVKFTLNGQPATVFDLRKGMTVSAEKIVEAPDVEITTDTKVVGSAPTPAEPPAPAAQVPAAQVPATPEPATEPAAPEAQGASNTLLWVGLFIAAVVIAIFLFRRSSAKQP